MKNPESLVWQTLDGFFSPSDLPTVIHSIEALPFCRARERIFPLLIVLNRYALPARTLVLHDGCHE